MKNLNNAAMVVGALMCSAMIGSALALLFAPAKGSETRAKLADGAKGMTDDMLNQMKMMKDEANVLMSKADEYKKIAVDQMDNVINTMKQRANAMIHHN